MRLSLVLLLLALLLLICSEVRADESTSSGKGKKKKSDKKSGKKSSKKGKKAVKSEDKGGNKKKTTKDWSKVDFNDVEKEWEGGDEEEELEHEFERQRKLNEKKQKEMGIAFDGSDPTKLRKIMQDPMAMAGMKGGSGGSMIFVDLTKKQPDGKPWDKKAEDAIASRLTALLKTNNLNCNIYNIGDHDTTKTIKGSKLLAQIDKGWRTHEVLRFLVRQPEVDKATLDNKDYDKSMLPEDEDDDNL